MQDLIKDIENKKFAPYYLLDGDEPFFLDLIIKSLEENVLEEEQKSFDRHAFYGSEASWVQIVNTAKQFPMFGGKQLVLVKEAQIRKEAHDLLSRYFEQPAAQTILIILLKSSLDKRSKPYKKAKEKGVVFSSKGLYDNQIPEFVRDQIIAFGREASQEVSFVLAENLGNNLSRIHQEIGKLDLLVEKGKAIDFDAVERYTGISKTYNNFELIDALAERNNKKILKIAWHFSKNKKDHPFLLSLTLVYNFFANLMVVHTLNDQSEMSISKALGLPPFVSRKYLAALRKYPLKKVTYTLAKIRIAFGAAVGVDNTKKTDGEKLMDLVLEISKV